MVLPGQEVGGLVLERVPVARCRVLHEQPLGPARTEPLREPEDADPARRLRAARQRVGHGRKRYCRPGMTDALRPTDARALAAAGGLAAVSAALVLVGPRHGP